MRKFYTSAEEVERRIESGEIIEQRICDFIRELNSTSEDRLNAVALTDGKREITYRQMFRKWEEFAEAYSAAGISGENGSRVALFGLTSIETILSLYALNMSGASVSMMFIEIIFDWKKFKRSIRNEGITDVVLLDNLLMPDVLANLHKEKRALGLRNIILLHADLRAPHFLKRLRPLVDLSSQFASKNPMAVYLDELAAPGVAASLHTEKDASEDAAIILHSSGTTSGTKKPIPYANSAINEGAARFLRDPKYREMFEGTAVTMTGTILSSCYFLIDQLHLPLAFGGKVYALPFQEVDPKNYMALCEEYGVTISFVGGPAQSLTPDMPDLDLSKLKLFAVGGMYYSPEKKKMINDFLHRCGMKSGVSIGYGLSEAGGACLLTEPGSTDDTLGKPLPGIKIKLLDEEDGKFYDVSDGQRRGVLHISTKSMSSGSIDGNVVFEQTEIDGEKYINTYDLVEVMENGDLVCVGRMNKFFANSGGMRYDAGLVERAVSAQPGILSCGIAPEYHKQVSDTVPVLYVKIDGTREETEAILIEALENIFIKEKTLEMDQLPVQCFVAEDIPYTDTGKVNTHKISDSTVKGVRYELLKTMDGARLTKIGLCEITSVFPDAETMRRNPKNDFATQVFAFILGSTDKLPDLGFGIPDGKGGMPPFLPGRKPGKKMRGGEADMMQCMPYYLKMMQGRKPEGMPSPEDFGFASPCGSSRSCRSCEKDACRMGERRPHRRRPSMEEFFRMMEAYADWDGDENKNEVDGRFGQIPPFFQYMMEQRGKRRFPKRDMRPPFPWFFEDEENVEEDEGAPKRRRFPKRDMRPPFPWFFEDEENVEEDEGAPKRCRFPKRDMRPPFPWFFDEEEDVEEDEDVPKRRPFLKRDMRPPFPWFFEDEEDGEAEDEDAPGFTAFGGPIFEMFSKLFHASDYDEFYEE